MSPGDSTPDATPGGASREPVRHSLPATERVLAGFCHDLNGQLASALGFVYLLPPTGGATGPVEHLRSSLDEIEVLVRRLRGLVREDTRSADPASLAELLEAVGAILPRHPRFPAAEIRLDTPDDLPAVRADFASAVRVLLLAIDAAAAGDEVTRIEVGVETRTDRVRVTFGPRGDGLHGSADPLMSEAREAGIAVGRDPGGRVLWLEFPKL